MKLTEDMLRRACRDSGFPPSDEPYVVLHPLVWEDYKRTFNLTEERMERWFVKAIYIE